MSKYKEPSFDSHQTEMFGNVQLRDVEFSDIPSVLKRLEDVFTSMKIIDDYFIIYHDDSESGIPHIHFILLLGAQMRMNTMCNKIAESFGVSTLAVSVKKLKSIVGGLKYVLHMTEESIEDGKKPYMPWDIRSNCSDYIIQGYLESESDDNVSTRLIKQLCIEASVKSEVLEKLGSLKLIKKNRYLIESYWDDKWYWQTKQDDLEAMFED